MTHLHMNTHSQSGPTQLYEKVCVQTFHQPNFQLDFVSCQLLATPAFFRGRSLKTSEFRSMPKSDSQAGAWLQEVCQDPLGTDTLKTLLDRGTFCSDSCCFSCQQGDSCSPPFQLSLLFDNFVNVCNEFQLFPSHFLPINHLSFPTSSFLRIMMFGFVL